VAGDRLAAILGFRRIRIQGTSDAVEIIYSGSVDTIPFKDPDGLAGRLAC